MITREDAVNSIHRQEFYFNNNGKLGRARVNGQCKTWKTQPESFELPMKYGLKQCFYISLENAQYWFNTPEEVKL